jgi:hypothetical protein
VSEKDRTRQLVLHANTEDQKRDAALYVARRCEDSVEISEALGLIPA